MQREVVIMPLVSELLNELLPILLEEEYFSYEENSIEYVKGILAFIKNVPNKRNIWRKPKSKKYGAWCCRYSPNKHTSWYIIFDVENEVYIIKYITNSHSEDYVRIIGERL